MEEPRRLRLTPVLGEIPAYRDLALGDMVAEDLLLMLLEYDNNIGMYYREYEFSEDKYEEELP